MELNCRTLMFLSSILAQAVISSSQLGPSRLSPCLAQRTSVFLVDQLLLIVADTLIFVLLNLLQAIKLLACTVAASEKVRAALTSSEAEVAQLMSGLRTDAGLEVNCSTARVIEVLAMHYFYSLTEEWVLHALARMVKEANNEAVRQQGLATLGSLANSLQRGDPDGLIRSTECIPSSDLSIMCSCAN